MKTPRLCLFLVFTIVGFPSTAEVAGKPSYDGPSIIADVINENRNFPEESFSNRLMISKYGLRLETASHGPDEKPNFLIQSFITQQAWLVDQTRKIFVELPQSDENPSREGGPTEDGSYTSGVAATSVCSGLTKKAAGTKRWHGADVSVWDCQLENGTTLRQYYSPHWRLVVREEAMTGLSSELKNIKRIELDPEFFKPPSDFRVTDFHELIQGVAGLKPYDERNE